MTIKDIDKLSKNISKFNPNSTEGHTIQAHLQDIDFYLEMRPHVIDRDRLYLHRATSSSEVRNFLDRQPSRTKSDYQLLREVLIKEFTNPDSEHGLLTALETKQGQQEAPHAYYNQLRQAYFGAHNEPVLRGIKLGAMDPLSDPSPTSASSRESQLLVGIFLISPPDSSKALTFGNPSFPLRKVTSIGHLFMSLQTLKRCPLRSQNESFYDIFF